MACGPISIHALLAESDFWSFEGVSLLRNFYPRSPCGERRREKRKCPEQSKFLSTLSLRRATDGSKSSIEEVSISIHALLAESDLGNVEAALPTWNFYPRSPCGERLSLAYPDMIICTFLSTLSLRRATSPLCRAIGFSVYFYPRSPCGERPSTVGSCSVGSSNFYPRSPCGERHQQ